MSHLPRRPRQAAFTLVELLVVIGIIALLIAILMPSLSRARQQSQRIACMSNMRQLGMATMQYTTENKGWFPRAAGGGSAFDDWIYWESARATTRDEGRLVKYLGTRFVEAHYICPSDNLNGHLTYPYSYTMNEFMGGVVAANNGDLHGRIKVTQVKRSAEKIMFIDESSQTIDDGCWAPQRYNTSSYKNLLSNRHDKKSEDKTDPNAGSGNALFCDGHASVIARKESANQDWYDPAR